MRQYSHQYDTKESLDQWISSWKTAASESILVQIFSGVVDVDYLRAIVQVILAKAPNAVIIGTTTSGEIMDGSMLDKCVVISASVFEQTKLKSVHLVDKNSETMGRGAAKAIIDKDTRCVIMFADGLACNGDAILRGFDQLSPHKIVVAGGMSGDNGDFKKCYCLHGEEIFEKGLVAVALSNPELEVFHTYNLSWKPLGKKMKVTKSEGNILHELDNRPVKEIYAKYLGENVVQNMPGSTIEFPLILQAGEVNIARSMISLASDDGIIYAGELPEGKMVQFGIGSPNMLTESAQKTYKSSLEHPIEGIFVFSCIARKAFLGKALESELEPLAKIAPLSGFFTYGEFYHGLNDNNLLNVTTTILALSESKEIKLRKDIEEFDFNYSSLTIGALVNLIEVTLEENEAYAQALIETNKSMQVKDNALNTSANGIIITDIDGNIEWANEAYCKLTGYSAEESVGLNPKTLVNSSMHDNAFFHSLWETILSKKVWHGEIVNRRKDGTLYNEEMTITPIVDDKGVITQFIAVKQDITERKKMEELIHKYAFYDTLTKLPNRRLLSDRFLNLQAISKRSGRYAAALFLDLDNFKPLNDVYGHTVGDKLLIEVSRRLNACVRESDTVSRFGGDEFVLLLSELSKDKDESIEQVRVVAEKIRLTLNQPYFLSVPISGNKEKVVEHKCTSSIGIALFIDYEKNEDDILKRADKAMYEAKEAGRDQIRFYSA